LGVFGSADYCRMAYEREGALTEPVLKDVTQICVVTADLDRAVRIWWDKYAVGPWHILELGPSTIDDGTIDDEPAEFAMRVANTMFGNMHLEIIQPLDDRSIYAASLKRHAGVDHMHHISCATYGKDDYERTIEQLRSKGLRSGQSGKTFGVEWNYVATDEDLGFAIEFIHMPDDFAPPEPESVYPPASIGSQPAT
jgi:methylmalonyl-CoA/ethylmalonyl-CoA epimerase